MKLKQKNTKRSTNTWLNVLNSWMSVRGYRKQATEYDPLELNSILERFYAELKKTDGNDYKPSCLRVMMSSIDRYVLFGAFVTTFVFKP